MTSVDCLNCRQLQTGVQNNRSFLLVNSFKFSREKNSNVLYYSSLELSANGLLIKRNLVESSTSFNFIVLRKCSILIFNK
jgi:hypothetical protein